MLYSGGGNQPVRRLSSSTESTTTTATTATTATTTTTKRKAFNIEFFQLVCTHKQLHSIGIGLYYSNEIYLV